MISAKQSVVSVLQGATSSSLTQVFALVTQETPPESFTITGPYSEKAETLSATFTLKKSEYVAPEGYQYLETIITDPLFWLSSNPALYRLNYINGESTEMIEFGLRDFHGKSSSFYLDGRRFFLRMRNLAELDLKQNIGALIDHSIIAVVDSPSSALCKMCSQQGVNLIADLRRQSNLQNELSRLLSYPAVLSAIIPSSTKFQQSPGAFAPHLPLGCEIENSGDATELAGWTKFIIRSIDMNETSVAFPGKLPEILHIKDFEFPTDHLTREPFDAIQRKIKGTADFAGIWID